MPTSAIQPDTGPSHAKSNPAGMQPIPARIGGKPSPLVVDGADSEIRAAIVDLLNEFAVKIAVVHRTAAEAYLSQDMYCEALPHLETAVRFAPEEAEFKNQLGFVHYLAGNDDAAAEAFRAVLAADANNPDALFNLGMVSFGRGDVTTAATCFRDAAQVRGDDAEIWNNLGVCMHRIGAIDNAKACFQQALQIEPENQDAIHNLQSL